MTKTVLIVDDIPFARKTLAEILSEAHFQIVGEASNGQEAIQLYTKLRPLLVTMDIVMPVMSGLDAAKRILRMDKDARIIIVSAMDQESLIMEAINVGVKDYLIKPFSTHELLQSIDHAFGADNKAGKSSQEKGLT